ncbi:RimJ/RimL family protein N-acetyltransferase [Haloactinopolyspora alba]|uniref:RimJ/RimL family protein N-acetyltransferase n=1 Tax=Haloactinopolyspora alba TaxID=648780 RepID=A0A2P8E8U3_9ACTN|nr:GNAT family N-acetyltransferase [Haloactinopolyspora alba]PSL05906.1 RimJ/RimL family protein N-acetyltransferase [Haloactinopolyspora alba]
MRSFDLASGELRDRLVAAVVRGDKTATTSLRVSYDVDDEPLPTPGLYRLLDRHDETIGVVEVTDVEIRRLGDVDDTVAHAEGEGYPDVAAWRRSHEEFWHSAGDVAAARTRVGGDQLDDDALVVVEWFRWRPELLATDRLLLRPLVPDDADAFAAMNADPAVMEHFTTGPLDRAASDAMLERHRERYAAAGFGLSAVQRHDDDTLLGFTGLNRHRWYPDDVEIGWRLVRHAWGRGYATEAARAWIRRAFGLLELPRLISITVPANERSVAVMRRLGFTLLKHDRQEDLDVVVYARDRTADAA